MLQGVLRTEPDFQKYSILHFNTIEKRTNIKQSNWIKAYNYNQGCFQSCLPIAQE